MLSKSPFWFVDSVRLVRSWPEPSFKYSNYSSVLQVVSYTYFIQAKFSVSICTTLWPNDYDIAHLVAWGLEIATARSRSSLTIVVNSNLSWAPRWGIFRQPPREHVWTRLSCHWQWSPTWQNQWTMDRDSVSSLETVDNILRTYSAKTWHFSKVPKVLESQKLRDKGKEIRQLGKIRMSESET